MINFIEKFILLLILILMIFFAGFKVEAVDYEIEGLITDINMEERSVRIGENWYCLGEDTIIMRNGLVSSLQACRPIIGENYQLGKLKFDHYDHHPIQLKVAYRVLEGLIREISLEEKWLKLDLFLQEPLLRESASKYYWHDKLTKGLTEIKILKSGDHLILITGEDIILKIIIEK